MEEHRYIVRQVLQILESNQLFLNPRNVSSRRMRLNILVSVLQAGQLAMDPIKTLGVSQIGPLPQNSKTSARSSVLQVSIVDSSVTTSRLARPLNDLTKKNLPLAMGRTGTRRLDRLKQRFLAAPILVQPDLTAPFHLECDAQNTLAAPFSPNTVLMVFGIPSPSCLNHLLKPNKTTISTIESFLAIVKALREWRHYLEGSPHQLEILSDHKNLEVFRHESNYPTTGPLGLNSSSLAFLSPSITSLERKLVNPMHYPVALTTSLITKIMRTVSSYRLRSLPNLNESPLLSKILLF